MIFKPLKTSWFPWNEVNDHIYTCTAPDKLDGIRQVIQKYLLEPLLIEFNS